MPKYIYKAEWWRYGPSLARFTVEKETRRTYIVTDCNDLIGVSYARMMRKGDAGLFENEPEAWLYLYTQSKIAVIREKMDLDEMTDIMNMLADKVKESSDEQNQPA
jgi:hypothetical protein